MVKTSQNGQCLGICGQDTGVVGFDEGTQGGIFFGKRGQFTQYIGRVVSHEGVDESSDVVLVAANAALGLSDSHQPTQCFFVHVAVIAAED